MEGLDQGQRTHMIDALKDMFDGMSAKELQDIGFSSGDADLLNIGEAIDISGVVDNPKTIIEALGKAKNLSPEDIQQIVQNNTKIAGWLQANKSQLTQIFDSGVIEKVLKGVI